jgi:hypothetical protein
MAPSDVTSLNTNKKRGISPIFILLVAGSFAWAAFRPIPTPADFQRVAGTLASATAVTKNGANEFTVQLWLKDQPHVAYRLAAQVSGEVLGEHQISPGRTVEMQALMAEIQNPSTGPLHNLPPSIQISSLTVDGHPISSWEDYQKFEKGQRTMLTWIGDAVVALGFFAILAQKRAAA